MLTFNFINVKPRNSINSAYLESSSSSSRTHGKQSRYISPTNNSARNNLMILDYKQFLAARTIQRAWRQYIKPKDTQRANKAAIDIQRTWRGYYVRSRAVQVLEQRLQRQLMTHYNKAATKIQALVRGYLIRKKVQDVLPLKMLKYCAAEDLLHCVALKLHHLLRTQSIPGVYSLRNSNCLSRVEKLLASMRFRKNTQQTRHLMDKSKSEENTLDTKFQRNTYSTKVPHNGAYKPECQTLLNRSKDLDTRMYNIISRFDQFERETAAKKSKQIKAEKKIFKLTKRRNRQRNCNFCCDLINSMSRWHIWDETNTVVSKDILKNPRNLERFLKEAEQQMNDFAPNCHCNIILYDVVQCT